MQLTASEAPPKERLETDDPAGPPPATTGGTEPTITESVLTSLAGIALGGATLWFVAPICFVC